MNQSTGWIKRIWYRKILLKTSFPNKCDSCAFKIKIEDDVSLNKFYAELIELQKYNLSHYPNRAISVFINEGNSANDNKDYLEFCALEINKKWGINNKHKKCGKRQIKLPTPEIMLSDYISIHLSNTNLRLSKILNAILIFLTIASIVISLVQFL